MNSNLNNLIETFRKMNDEGWPVTNPLKYGFYFVDNEKNKLELVFNELKDKNYILENIYQSDDNKWTLHVSKIDVLTPEKLHKRNIAFNELAEYFELELYDGWDVEKPNLN